MAVVTGDSRGLRLAVRYLVLALVGTIFLFPLIFMVMSSFKPTAQLLSDTSSLRAFLPVGDISLDNYFAAFRRAPIGLYFAQLWYHEALYPVVFTVSALSAALERAESTTRTP